MTAPTLYIPRRREIVLPGERCRRCGRPIRLPRRHVPSRRRRRLPLRLAGNAVQVGAVDSFIRIKDNAIVVAGDTDPCCCPRATQDCNRCEVPGDAPVTYHVTLAGINACLNCAPVPGTGFLHWMRTTSIGNPSGTYTITRLDPSPNPQGVCNWEATFPYTGVTQELYTAGSCDPPVDSVFQSTTLTVNYVRFLNTGLEESELRVYTDLGDLFLHTGFAVSSTILLCSGGTVSNQTTTPCAWPTVGGDGTATLTPA